MTGSADQSSTPLWTLPGVELVCTAPAPGTVHVFSRRGAATIERKTEDSKSLYRLMPLGTLPGGGYGILWRRGPAGLGQMSYWFPWEPPQDPVRIEFEGQELIFCRDTAEEAEIAQARRVAYEQSCEVR